ncbi:serine hydrolase [Lactobacillus sp. S2-2]|uniref:serine hydrolase n=1 Tax=Lactobacillus sp. S2-2 TaxID=2692917 RepID=UPI001F380D02|nr:serine hydrolase [Lactobacillus sp. S2-2]MCF6515456.1 serine hydrolase [Lactobacillus sp. S2-2]
MTHKVKLNLSIIFTLCFLTFIPSTVNAKTFNQNMIKSTIKKDMKNVGGSWAVQVNNVETPMQNVSVQNTKIKRYRSASTIKVYIMLATYYQVQNKTIKLTPVIKQNLARMIKYSDNNAANYLIRKNGGFSKINKISHKFGFKHTSLKRFMLNNKALANGIDNYTTPQDLSLFLKKVYHKELLGKTYDNKMLYLLNHCQNHSKLPRYIKNTKVFNKTGELPVKGVQNDAAIFKTKYHVYSVVVMSQKGNQYYQYHAMNQLGKHLHKIIK